MQEFHRLLLLPSACLQAWFPGVLVPKGVRKWSNKLRNTSRQQPAQQASALRSDGAAGSLCKCVRFRLCCCAACRLGLHYQLFWPQLLSDSKRCVCRAQLLHADPCAEAEPVHIKPHSFRKPSAGIPPEERRSLYKRGRKNTTPKTPQKHYLKDIRFSS